MSKNFKSLLIVLAVLVIADIGLGLYSVFGYHRSQLISQDVFADGLAVDTVAVDEAPMLNDEARAYLMSNSSGWSRTKLDELGLADLYDDLNNYNYEAITGKWASTFREIGHSEVVEAASTHVDGLTAPFTYAGSINLTTYVSKISSN